MNNKIIRKNGFRIEHLDIENDNDNKYNFYRLDQDLFSFSLYYKGVIYNNPTLLYFLSVFNLFQNLTVYNNTNRIVYVSCSQKLTSYFLKLCERQGIVKIVSSENYGLFNFNDYYSQIGNDNHKTNHDLLEVDFLKLRSFTEDDIPFINIMLRFLKIDKDAVLSKDLMGVLKVKANRQVLKNSLVKASLFTQFKEANNRYNDVTINVLRKHLSKNKIS